MEPFEVAERHIRARSVVADAAVADVLRWWWRINPGSLDQGWDAVAAAVVEIVTAAEVEAAKLAQPFVQVAAKHAGTKQVAAVVPEAFGGVTQDGREIGPAMFGAVTTTKSVIATGRAPLEAMRVGASYLATIVGAAVHDMGRQADGVAAVGSRLTHYVRALSPGACSRCAVLAGKSSARVPFKRHPRCRCVAFPITTNTPAGFFTNPSQYFESLTPADQDAVFTESGAESIRHGANISQVVNARRGAYGIGYNSRVSAPSTGVRRRLQPVTVGVRSDGSPLRVYATVEDTTVRGLFGRREVDLTARAIRDGRYRRSTSIRLMPEQIAVMAGGDPLRWIELLRRYGYLY